MSNDLEMEVYVDGNSLCIDHLEGVTTESMHDCKE